MEAQWQPNASPPDGYDGPSFERNGFVLSASKNIDILDRPHWSILRRLADGSLEWVTNLEFSRFADSKNESEKKDDEIIAAQNAADRHLAGLG